MERRADQEAIFMNGEGDNYFSRNRHRIDTVWQAKTDICLSLIKNNGLNPHNVLEIGVTNIYRLATIAQQYDAVCSGIDPSREAIKAGKIRYPSLCLCRGVASSLPFENEEFDIIIMSFVFHWVDRKNLLKSASEIDRVLQQNGHLIIGDFFPKEPSKIKYHHLPDGYVWTYKQDYSKIFSSTNLYSIERKITTGKVPEEKRAFFLLKKKEVYRISASGNQIRFGGGE